MSEARLEAGSADNQIVVDTVAAVDTSVEVLGITVFAKPPTESAGRCNSDIPVEDDFLAS